MKAFVYVTLKPSVLDPQGKAIHHSVELLGHENIGDIRQGKYFEDRSRRHGVCKPMPESLRPKGSQKMCSPIR